MIQPYPIRTIPFFRDYLWGGRKLGEALGKAIPDSGTWAESWEFIDHPDHQSQIANGEWAGCTLAELSQRAPEWLFGKSIPESGRIPLLLKYLDCQRVLSVQVHPDDSYASQMTPPDLGKTEAWYIVSAEPGAKLYAGLRPDVNAGMLRSAIEEGSVEQCLHVLHPTAGDCIFIPAGTVHALGAGLLVAEIQQASNTTFRLFDWNRTGPDGQPRELHVSQALEVIAPDSGPRAPQKAEATGQLGRSRLVECDKFILDRISGVERIEVAGDHRFHFLTVPQGSAQLCWGPPSERLSERLTTGQSLLLPGTMQACELILDQPDTTVLDMYLP